MTRILITSDFHLDAVTAGVPRFDDLKRALNEVWQEAKGCDAFLFLGDLCNPGTGRCHRAVAAAAKLAAALGDLKIPGLWLDGNHDVVEDGHGSHTLMPLRSVSTWQQVADKPGVYGVGPLKVLALPFTPRSHAYDPVEVVEQVHADKLGPVDVVVGHLNLEGVAPGGETRDMPRGREVFFPYDLCRKRFPKALLLNGHYHAGQFYKGKLGKNKQGVYIPGSLERLTFGEERNVPGWLLAEGSRGKVWKVKIVSRATGRKLVTIGLGDPGDVEGAIVRVRPPAGSDPDEVDKVETATWAGGAYAVKVLPPEPGGPVVAKDGKPKENWGLRPRRELVDAMVAEANSKDPEALAALTGEVMDEEGL